MASEILPKYNWVVQSSYSIDGFTGMTPARYKKLRVPCDSVPRMVAVPAPARIKVEEDWHFMSFMSFIDLRF